MSSPGDDAVPKIFNTQSRLDYSKLNDADKQTFHQTSAAYESKIQAENEDYARNKDARIAAIENKLLEHLDRERQRPSPPDAVRNLRTAGDIRREATTRAAQENEARVKRLRQDQAKALDRVLDKSRSR